MSVGDFLPLGLGGIIVDVEPAQGGPGDQSQALVVRSAFVQMIGVGQDAGLGMTRRDRDVGDFAQFVELRGESPQLERRCDVMLVAQFE